MLAAEVTSGSWPDNEIRYCTVTFTAAEATNLARIQKTAAERFLKVFEAERGNYSEAELAYLDHKRIYHADRVQIFFNLPVTTPSDEQIAANDAKTDQVREDLIAELDSANGSVEEQLFEYESFATQLGEADFYARVNVEDLAQAQQFRNESAVRAAVINPDYSAEDELKLTSAGIQAGGISDRLNSQALKAANNEVAAAHQAQFIVAGRACAEAFGLTTNEHPLADDIAADGPEASIAGWKEVMASGDVPEIAGQEYFYAQPLEGEHTVAKGVTLPTGSQKFPNTGNAEFDQSLIGKIVGAVMIALAGIGLFGTYVLPVLQGLLGLTSS